ncbi:caspase recruitment domain-containing protein 19 isoform X1 [Piliocolobus tephrosceles]|uniref:caspase recruitment domain-containing protein 19 isoform X1 n=1 Tax=Piliocolobus tephrosceles TaxID=591936 RepID=UPI000C29BA1C|nr:caspase recruitment domain-containing protein 19 isoform X1 [Piliocolobus tephrosceles]
MTDKTYCDRLVQDTPFLTGHGRLSEQQVDRIILQLNRYYPQILTNKEAEKFRNPKASLRVRLCDLLSHLQRSGERDCQEFYRALYIHAQPLHSCLPSRHALQNSDCTQLDSGSQSGELSDRGNASLLPRPLSPSLFTLPRAPSPPQGLLHPECGSIPGLLLVTDPLRCSLGALQAAPQPGTPTPLRSPRASGPHPSEAQGSPVHAGFSPGPMSFLAGLGLAVGLALLLYCYPPDPKGLPGTRRVLGFSPVIIDRHVSRYLLAFLADDLGGL